MDFDLTSYAENLREHAARFRAEHERQQATKAKRQTVRKLDYAGTVRTWWNAQPPRASQHPWSLKTIAAAVFADQPRNPSIQHVAEALRQIGFTEHRDWTVAGRNRRLWLPPSNKQEKNCD